MKKVIATVIMGSCLLLADSLFVIGAYQIGHKSWLATAHDSLRLNTVKPSWLINQDSIDAYLDEAASETLNVILPEAAPASGRRFGFYSNLWHALWESEDTMFNHTTVEGKVVVDTSASNDSASVCSLGVDQEGLMQTGRSQWQLKIYSYDWHASWVEYTAIFRLKIDTTSLDDTTRVCRLTIFEPPDSVYNETVLTIGDFQQQNVYEVCSLTFRKDSVSHNLIWYNIYWYENVTLWSDYVEVKDEHIDILKARDYDDLLGIICGHYEGKSALYYYYLKDEPRFGHFAASRYLVDYLNRS